MKAAGQTNSKCYKRTMDAIIDNELTMSDYGCGFGGAREHEKYAKCPEYRSLRDEIDKAIDDLIGDEE